MNELREYVVVIGGVEHTIQTTEAEAAERGLKLKAAPAPANKARTPRNKSGAQ